MGVGVGGFRFSREGMEISRETSLGGAREVLAG